MSARFCFLAELQRRNVHRAALFYAGAAWLIVQVATQVFPFFDIANSVVRAVILMLLIGFPFAMLFSWFYEWTPQGILRTSEIEQDDSIHRQTGRHLKRAILAVSALADVLRVLNQVLPLANSTPAPQPWQPRQFGAAAMSPVDDVQTFFATLGRIRAVNFRAGDHSVFRGKRCHCNCGVPGWLRQCFWLPVRRLSPSRFVRMRMASRTKAWPSSGTTDPGDVFPQDECTVPARRNPRRTDANVARLPHTEHLPRAVKLRRCPEVRR